MIVILSYMVNVLPSPPCPRDAWFPNIIHSRDGIYLGILAIHLPKPTVKMVIIHYIKYIMFTFMGKHITLLRCFRVLQACVKASVLAAGTMTHSTPPPKAKKHIKYGLKHALHTLDGHFVWSQYQNKFRKLRFLSCPG